MIPSLTVPSSPSLKRFKKSPLLAAVAAAVPLLALCPTEALMAQEPNSAPSSFRLPPSPENRGPEVQGPQEGPQNGANPPQRPAVPESPAEVVMPVPAPVTNPAAAVQPVAPPARTVENERQPVPTPNQARPAVQAQAQAAVEAVESTPPTEEPSAAASEWSSPSSPPPEAPSANAKVESETSPSWLIALGVVLAALGAGGVLWKRRQDGAAKPVPVIMRPVVPKAAPQEPAPTPPPVPAKPQASPPPPPAPAAPVTCQAGPLELVIEAPKFSLTLMNAALTYSITLTNKGDKPLSAITLWADLFGAHPSVPRALQLSGPDQSGQPLTPSFALEPGETRILAGDLRLPLSSIRPIQQGDALTTLPLARFALGAEGAETTVHVLSLGDALTPPRTASDGKEGPLTPFRLDQGPRIFPRPLLRLLA